MIKNTKYHGVLKYNGQELYSTENDCPNKLFIILICKLEDEYRYAKALVTNKTTGEIIYQGKRSAIC